MKRLREEARSGEPKRAFAAELLDLVEPFPEARNRRDRVAASLAEQIRRRSDRRAARSWRPALAAVALLLVLVAVAGATVMRRIVHQRAAVGQANTGAPSTRGPLPPPIPAAMKPQVDDARPIGPRQRAGDRTLERDPVMARQHAPAGESSPRQVASPAPGSGSTPLSLPATAQTPDTSPVAPEPVPTAATPKPGPVGGSAGSHSSTAAPAVAGAAPGFVEEPPSRTVPGATAGIGAAEPPQVRVPSAELLGRSAVPRVEAEMVEAAIDALRNQEQPLRAARLLATYLERFPHGVLVEDALALSIETAAGRDPSRARALARDYLQRFPGGRYQAGARQVLGQPVAPREGGGRAAPLSR